jgi:hypothetical protein
MKTFFMAMTAVASLTVLCIHPVFAQMDSGYPAEASPERETAPVIPDLGQSWDVGPSRGDPALAPTPGESMDSEPAPMFGGYTPVHPVNPEGAWMEPPESRFAQPFVNPAFSEAVPPIGEPQGGFYRPVR